ncbi:MAG TPA: SDR family oxidoreductase [Polyangiaceae bacterium]
MPRTAFVTGGTGFLGRHVVEQLVGAGWHVVALHRASSDVRGLKTYDGVRLAEGSIVDPGSLGRAMPEGCDAVFHIAGNTSLWSGGNAEQTRDNVDGTRNVVEAAIAKGAKKLVQTSTQGSWGEVHENPFDETTQQRGGESWINYERTKYLGELEVLKGVERGLHASILCPGHIMGRYDTHNWATVIKLVATEKLPGVPPGEGTWGDAREIARAHLAAVDTGRDGERYLLGGVHASYLDVVQIIARLTGKKVPRKATPVWVIRVLGRVSQWGSYFTRKAPTITPEIAAATARPPLLFKSDKAIRELGYRVVPLEETLRDAYEWLKSEKLVPVA